MFFHFHFPPFQPGEIRVCSIFYISEIQLLLCICNFSSSWTVVEHSSSSPSDAEAQLQKCLQELERLKSENEDLKRRLHTRIPEVLCCPISMEVCQRSYLYLFFSHLDTLNIFFSRCFVKQESLVFLFSTWSVL